MVNGAIFNTVLVWESLDNIIDAETEKTLQRDSRDVMSNWKDKEIGLENRSGEMCCHT